MRTISIATYSAVALLLAGACSVFDPPSSSPDGGASGGSTNKGSGGAGNTDASLSSGGHVASGGSISSGGSKGRPDASVDGAVESGAGGSGEDTGPGAGGAPPNGPWWIETNKDGCETLRPPTSADRPAVSDPGADLPPIYLAQSRARYGSAADDATLSPDPTAWEGIGFNLDGVCTNSDTCGPEAGRIKETACKYAILPQDGNECRDNQIGFLYKTAASSPAVGSLFGFTEPDWNCEMYRGGFTIMFKVSNYNGKKNDSSVRFDMYASTGLQKLPGWKCRTDITAPLNPDWYKFAPWLPTSHWKIARRSIDLAGTTNGTDVPNSNVADSTAFVRGGYLFARLPEASELWLDGENTPIPGIRLTMRRPFIIGELVRLPDDTWTIKHGTLAMVVLPGDMLNSFQEFGFCKNMCASFDTLKGYFNAATDMLATTDEILPDAPCDALSSAYDFEARQATATVSDIVDVAPPVVCPQPRNPAVPRQGCVCQSDNVTCLSPDAG